MLIQNEDLTPEITNSISFLLTTGAALLKEPVHTPTIPIHKSILQTLLLSNRTACDTTDATSRIAAQEDTKKTMESISATVESQHVDHTPTVKFADEVAVLRQVNIAHDPHTPS